MAKSFESSPNASLNSTRESSEWMSNALINANVALDVLILVVSVFGNVLVISTIVREKNLRTTCNFLLLHLAICDISLVVVSIPFDIYSLYHGSQWDFGMVFCKLLWPANTLFYISGALILTVISIDRYRVFVQTFKRKLRCGQVKRIIAVIYIFSLVSITPYCLVLQVEAKSCFEAWPKFLYRQLYTVFLFSIEYALPLIIMCFIYIRIGLQLTRKTQRVRLSRRGPRSKISLYSSDSTRDTYYDRARKQRSRKALKMIIVVVVVFAVFMLPFQLIWIIADIGGNIDPEQLTKLNKLFVIFSYIGSCTLNPFIYGIGDRRFRRGYQSFLYNLVRLVTAHRTAQLRKASHVEDDDLNISRGTVMSGTKSTYRAGKEVVGDKETRKFN